MGACNYSLRLLLRMRRFWARGQQNLLYRITEGSTRPELIDHGGCLSSGGLSLDTRYLQQGGMFA
jgi:hypothetical protein